MKAPVAGDTREGLRPAEFALLLSPGALTVALGFAAGGFNPSATAATAILLLSALAIRVALVESPFAGAGRLVAAAILALALHAAWTLASGLWSAAPGRALLEFDRALLYLSALALFGSARQTAARLEWGLRGLALGVVVVCLAGLAARLLPEVGWVPVDDDGQRLSYPVGYWNTMGLLAALGLVVCLHLASGERAARPVRVLAATAMPPLTASLLLTFSRGAVLVAAIGVLAYAVLGRPRRLPAALLVAMLTCALAVVLVLQAESLTLALPSTPEEIAQGRQVGLAVALCGACAGLLLGILGELEARLGQFRLPRRAALAVGASAAVAAILALSAVTAGSDLWGEVERRYERLAEGSPIGDTPMPSDRLLEVSNNGRTSIWRVALQASENEPRLGTGAGTFELLWHRGSPLPVVVVDGHSIYLEVLAELGPVGLVTVAACLLILLAGLLARARGPQRAGPAALFAAALAWVVHAGLDYDWEMPVVTLWLFALGGFALARAEAGPGDRLPPSRRAVAVLALLGLAAAPSLVIVSQTRLDAAIAAFRRGDCSRAVDRALAANATLPLRPEPYRVLTYCYARQGSPRLAVATARRAVARSPADWRLQYDLAWARSSAGLDPRPAARAAQRRNPLDPTASDLERAVEGGGSKTWRRRAAAARQLPP